MGAFRLFTRSIIYSYISLYVTQVVIGAFRFSETSFISLYLLIVFALGVLYFFMRPVLSIIGLPSRGVFFMFMSSLITFITLYVLTVIIPSFEIVETIVQELRFFGFVLPSKRLSVNWATICSALSFSVVMNFFEWMARGKE